MDTILNSDLFDHICWDFDRKSPNAPQTEPIQGELFVSEVLEAPASALVRETIQNSLDARLDEGRVRVRFTLQNETAMIGFQSPWLKGLKEHLQAEGNGLRDRPQNGQEFSTLLIEDYGTCGLPGNTAQTNDTAEAYRGQRNHFFYFWRAIGSSGKTESERGSWGLGKSVLPASSTLNTFFGISSQNDTDEMRLFGLSVLRHHNLATDEEDYEPFTPYGRFGQRPNLHHAIMPVVNDSITEAFCSNFGITRKGLPGLSLLVISPQDKFTPSALISASIMQYFYPILEDKLIVEIVVGEAITTINAQTIKSCAENIKDSFKDFLALLDTLSLAEWSIQQRRGQLVTLKAPSNPKSPKWDDSIVNIDEWERVQKHFLNNEPVEFCIPLSIFKRNGDECETEFFVCLKKAPDEQRAKISYLRDGITISGIKETVSRGLTAFVTVDGEKSQALARYLRQAENPAHTEWNEESKRLKDDYLHHTLALRYVKNSVRALYERLKRQQEGIDKDLLADIFFIDEEYPNEINNLEKQSGGRGVNPENIKLPSFDDKGQIVHITTRSNCIVFTGVTDYSMPDQIIRVQIAYDVRRGNPFKKWSPQDFDFGMSKSMLETHGASIIKAEGYKFEFRVDIPNFEIFVHGIDFSRDVRIDAQQISENL